MYLTAATRNGGFKTINGCSSNPSNFAFNSNSRALVCLALSLFLFSTLTIYKFTNKSFVTTTRTAESVCMNTN
jgi:hypothetical protein